MSGSLDTNTKIAILERDTVRILDLLEKIDESTASLNEAWSQISTKLYQQSQEAPTNSDNNSDPNDEVQDADFEEVK